jgi:predicted Rossmann fold nucleotide-binding protein DprA/Smf involved in DNA uptake
MDFSSTSSDLKPLSNAEFHTLLEAIKLYNGAESEQLNLFQSDDSFNFAFLTEIDLRFLEDKLGIKSELSNRIMALLKRSAAISFEIERLKSIAKVVTVFDDGYPQKLKCRLGKLPKSMREPALLYFCGDLGIQKINFVGFVGARNIDDSDKDWTESAIKRIYGKAKNEKDVIGIVSGGAEGIDQISEYAALQLSMPVIEFSKNMKISLDSLEVIDAVQDQNMLLFSEVNPLRRLSKYEAMAHFTNRNKYIYAMSEYAVVVKSAKGSKSGTWKGATEALEKNICKVYVRNAKYEGNVDLITRGGVPIS